MHSVYMHIYKTAISDHINTVTPGCPKIDSAHHASTDVAAVAAALDPCAYPYCVGLDWRKTSQDLAMVLW